MLHFKERTTVLQGRICDHISNYIKEFKPDYDKGFEIFSDEDILYALLEYSRYPRPYDKKQRIKYIYDKCVSISISNKGLLPYEYTVELEHEYDDETWIIVPKNKPLPF
jgi:hypothetical protein